MGSPVIFSLAPLSGKQGETLPNVQINGQNTNFGAASAVEFSGTGVTTVGSVAVVSEISLRANVAIAASASVGPRDVTVTTGSEVATGTGLFMVLESPPPPPPAFGSITPASGARGDTEAVSITGVNTKFDASSQLSFSSSGIAASDILALDDTHLTATLTIDAAAALGPSDVTVTTGNQSVTGAFDVIPSEEKAEILREAVNTYLRQNHVTGHAQDICEAFVANINQGMRDANAGKAVHVTLTLPPVPQAAPVHNPVPDHPAPEAGHHHAAPGPPVTHQEKRPNKHRS